MEYQPKFNEQHALFTFIITSFEGTSYIIKLLRKTATSSYFFTVVFTSSADTIFHNFSELHSTTEKNFCHKVSFFNRHTQTCPTFINGQN